MATMKQESISDCSCTVGSIAYNIRDDIDSTIARLKAVIEEEASLCRALHALFLKRKEEAIEQVRLATLHLDLVTQEEAALTEDLARAAASAKYVCFSIFLSDLHIKILIFYNLGAKE